jgi:hypothetical protein
VEHPRREKSFLHHPSPVVDWSIEELIFPRPQSTTAKGTEDPSSDHSVSPTTNLKQEGSRGANNPSSFRVFFEALILQNEWRYTSPIREDSRRQSSAKSCIMHSESIQTYRIDSFFGDFNGLLERPFEDRKPRRFHRDCSSLLITKNPPPVNEILSTSPSRTHGSRNGTSR